MKWKIEKEPTLGDKYTLTRFAFWPVTTDNGYEVWLEKYIEHREYAEVTIFDGFEVYPGLSWVRTARYAILDNE